MDVKKILEKFQTLNNYIQNADERDCIDLLKAEQLGANRQSILLRIHARFNKVRRSREVRELVDGREFDSVAQLLKKD